MYFNERLRALTFLFQQKTTTQSNALKTKTALTGTQAK
jgi:hypothetical protein